MKSLSLEFKNNSIEVIQKLEELLFILQKEWKALIERDFEIVWRCSKEKNDIFVEINSIKLKLDCEADSIIKELGLEGINKTDEKLEIIKNNLIFEEYVQFDSFINRYKKLKKEISRTAENNFKWAHNQINNISKIMEILLPRQDDKNVVYSPMTMKKRLSAQKSF